MAEVTKEAFETANAKLVRDVYAPVFFDVLRHRGIVPVNEKEAQDLLILGEAARAAREQAEVAEPTSRFSKLAASVQAAPEVPDTQTVIDSAAVEFSKSAELVNAALAVTQYTVDNYVKPVTQKGK